MTDARVRRRDEGSALPLVLVMMVLGALIVIPMLSYTVAVLRANTVVVDANREREAAEANVRIALLDPMALYSECTASAVAVDLVADEVLADPDLAGTTRCDHVSEVSALNALGFQTPTGITATQMNATVPAMFTGERTAVPAGDTAEDWWVASARSAAETGTIWLPDLPTYPSSTRTTSPGVIALPYSMPAQFGCKVYLPGRYTQPLKINPTDLGTNRVYFASGVYYFESDVTVSGAIDVIAGYGSEGFTDSECADDLQVSGNLIGGPASYGIDGVGATFVFGGAGRLVVQNGATGTGPSLRFNQRYGDNDGGGRVSIMSVNGVNGNLNAPQLFVDDVVAVPRSNVSRDGVTVAIGTNGQTYTPSNDTLTSAPRVPAAPVIVSATAYRTTTAPPHKNGVLLVWDDVLADKANGALVTDYAVTVGGATTNVCPAAGIVGGPQPGQLACFVGNLTTSGNVTLSVKAFNSAGWSAAAQQTVTMRTTPVPPQVAVPGAIDPAAVTVEGFSDALRIDWPDATNNGSVVTGYDVVVERVYRYVPASVTTVPATTVPAVTDPSTTVDTSVTTTTTEPYDPSTTTTTLAPTTTTSTTTTTTTVPPAPIDAVDTTFSCGPRAASWTAVASQCIVRGVGNLDTTAGRAPNGGTYLGYRITVQAINGVGVGPVSAPTAITAAVGSATAPADPVPPVRSFDARKPDFPIVDVQLDGAARSTVAIPGYVSIPMGRLRVQNTPGHDVRINGGLLASTFDVTDGRAGPADAPRPSSVPVGYINDIVLQRTVRVTSTVGRTSVVATVQINENGEFAVNSWLVE